MEKNQNYNKIPPYIDLDYDLRQNNIYDKDPFFNPIMQYGQAYVL